MPNPGKPKLAVDGWHLLTVIAERGARWPETFSDQSTEALAEAVGRQIVIGNLIDGATLSKQGREALRRHHATHPPTDLPSRGQPAKHPRRQALLPEQRR